MAGAHTAVIEPADMDVLLDLYFEMEDDCLLEEEIEEGSLKWDDLRRMQALGRVLGMR